MSIDSITNNIIEWGNQKGILPDPEPLAQLDKTKEEVAELETAIYKRDDVEAKDAIGDIYVTLVMQAEAWGFTMNECIESAYNEIKDRTGKMVDGQFVKDK